MVILSIPPCVWATGAVVLIIVIFSIIPSKGNNPFEKNPDPSSSGKKETRAEARINSEKETRDFLMKDPDKWGSDGVMPIIGWRKLK